MVNVPKGKTHAHVTEKHVLTNYVIENDTRVYIDGYTVDEDITYAVCVCIETGRIFDMRISRLRAV